MTDIYGTEGDADTYHSERGNTDWAVGSSANKLAALLRASEYIDGRYRTRFPGEPAVLRQDGGQDREWPRISTIDSALYDIYDQQIPENSTPNEIKKATYEIALRELATPGIMQPDINKSDRRKSVSVEGAVSITYADINDVESYRTVVTIVDALLAPILTRLRADSPLSARGYRV